MAGALTDIPGIKVGHASDFDGITGCTVVLCEGGAIAGVDQRGGGPGTREIALLDPVNNVQQVHAVVLSGGSAFGLESATGVMRYLEENNIGYQTGVAKVPIVPAAILFDLGIGDSNARPDAEMGYTACQNASTDPPAQGSVGAGTGATVGKMLGIQQGVKSGIGTACIEISGGVTVGALVAVNAIGDIIDPNTGKIIAGARPIQKGPIKIGGDGFFVDSLSLMGSMVGRSIFSLADKANTVIGVVATNAKLDKAGATKVAQMAQNGVVRCVRPANTMHDGDTMFALSIGKKKANINIIGAYASQAVQMAILNAIAHAIGLGGIPALSDFQEET